MLQGSSQKYQIITCLITHNFTSSTQSLFKEQHGVMNLYVLPTIQLSHQQVIKILWHYSLLSKFFSLTILLSINYGILSHRYYVSTFAHIWKLLPYCFHFKSSIISLLVSSLDSTFIHDAHTPWCCKVVHIISLELNAKLLCLHRPLFDRF